MEDEARAVRTLRLDLPLAAVAVRSRKNRADFAANKRRSWRSGNCPGARGRRETVNRDSSVSGDDHSLRLGKIRFESGVLIATVGEVNRDFFGGARSPLRKRSHTDIPRVALLIDYELLMNGPLA